MRIICENPALRARGGHFTSGVALLWLLDIDAFEGNTALIGGLGRYDKEAIQYAVGTGLSAGLVDLERQVFWWPPDCGGQRSYPREGLGGRQHNNDRCRIQRSRSVTRAVRSKHATRDRAERAIHRAHDSTCDHRPGDHIVIRACHHDHTD